MFRSEISCVRSCRSTWDTTRSVQRGGGKWWTRQAACVSPPGWGGRRVLEVNQNYFLKQDYFETKLLDFFEARFFWAKKCHHRWSSTAMHSKAFSWTGLDSKDPSVIKYWKYLNSDWSLTGGLVENLEREANIQREAKTGECPCLQLKDRTPTLWFASALPISLIWEGYRTEVFEFTSLGSLRSIRWK